MDSLSTVLELLELRVAASARLEAAGDWGLTFPRPGRLKIIAVIQGTCWAAAGGNASIELETGDCLLLSGEDEFSVASSADADLERQQAVLPGPWPATAHYGDLDAPEDSRTVLVSGRFDVDTYAAALLLDRVPSVVRIAADSAEAQQVAPVLVMLGREAANEGAPGALAIRRQLTQVLFVQVLRALLVRDQRPSGWLGALADPPIAATLDAIHGEPERSWTVADLAGLTSMSRSAFSTRFRQRVGTPPLDYLIGWRIELAAKQLRQTDRSVASIGASVGYPSETTFSSTFRRVKGISPGRYRTTSRTGPASSEAAP